MSEGDWAMGFSGLAKFRYFSGIVCLTLILVLVLGGMVAASPEVELSDRKEIDRLHENIIDLAVRSSSVLEQQRELVDVFDEVSPPDDGRDTVLDLDAGLSAARDENGGDYYASPELGFNLSYPLSDPSTRYSQQQNRLSFLADRVGEKKKLERDERELVRELNRRLESLFEQENRLTGQQKLLSTLQERRTELREMVDSGLADPDELWELDEKINEIEVEVNNLRSRRLVLINEIASNFGRDNRAEMKEMLQEIVYYLGEENND
ncbi:MAG: TolC family protein [Bacillota bacterium]